MVEGIAEVRSDAQWASMGAHTQPAVTCLVPAQVSTTQYSSTPLAIDLFCGLGGWTEGLLAEGYRVVGFDIERHEYGHHRYPAQLVLQDVLTIHGAQFRHASLIVASPPCQAYSYRAMPWSRARALPPPDNSLFEACFRIQREACAAAGRHIPMVVENVRGAQKWVGPAAWHFGSFYLWGDVPALMPIARRVRKVSTMGAGWYPPGHPKHVPGLAFNTHAERAVQSDGIKHGGDYFNDPTWAGKQGGTKQPGISGRRKNGKGDRWFQDGAAAAGSKSRARKAASALIAKIPLALSRHIAATYKPEQRARLEATA